MSGHSPFPDITASSLSLANSSPKRKFARRHVGEEFHVEGVEVGGHAVGRGDGAQPDDAAVCAVVAHDADGANGQDDGEGLAHVVVEPGAADLLDEESTKNCACG
jgi:hypothetical protein